MPAVGFKKWKSSHKWKVTNQRRKSTYLPQPFCLLKLFDNYVQSLGLSLSIFSQWSICKKDISLLIFPSAKCCADQIGPPLLLTPPFYPDSPSPRWRSAIQVPTGFCTPWVLGPATGQRYPGIGKLLSHKPFPIFTVPLRPRLVSSLEPW